MNPNELIKVLTRWGGYCVIAPSDTNSEIENLLTPSAYFEEMKVKVEENAHKTKV